MGTAATRGVNRPRSTHSRSTVVSSKTPTRSTADVVDDTGSAHLLRRQSTTMQRRLTPIDKRHKNRSAKKRRGRRPEATEVTSHYGGQDTGSGGPKFRVTSGARRGRLKPLISRRSRLGIAEAVCPVPVPPAAKREDRLSNNLCETDSHPQIQERGTTFTSAVVPGVSVEGCRSLSPFQLHYLPLSLTASTSGSDLDTGGPPSKSSETGTPQPSPITYLCRQSQKPRQEDRCKDPVLDLDA